MTRKLSLLIVLFVAVPLFAQSEPAQSEPERKTGITFSVANAGGDVSFRRLLPPNWAVLGSLGYAKGTAYPNAIGAPSADVTNWILSAGVRRYFASDELRPFAEASAGISWYDLPGCDATRSPRASAGGGVEYRVAKRVSIEGSAGLGYSKTTQRCEGFNGIEYRYEYDSLSTFRTALSVTFYF